MSINGKIVLYSFPIWKFPYRKIKFFSFMCNHFHTKCSKIFCNTKCPIQIPMIIKCRTKVIYRIIKINPGIKIQYMKLCHFSENINQESSGIKMTRTLHLIIFRVTDCVRISRGQEKSTDTALQCIHLSSLSD